MSTCESTRAVPPRGAGGSAGASTVTQARSPATRMACGLPPTSMRAIGRAARGSMRATVPSPLFATHTAP
jgi:hypothetical protein